MHQDNYATSRELVEEEIDDFQIEEDEWAIELD